MLSEVGLQKPESAYDAFEHFRRSLNLGGRQLVAMFTAYFDESYGTANAYSVAGYVGTVDQWDEFKREWDGLCDEHQVSAIHKTDLETLWGEYKKWQSLP